MAVGDIQCTMIFKEFITGQSLGWSESHFHVTAANLDEARADLAALATLRVNLLGAGVLLQSLRVSDVSVWRDSRIGFSRPAVDTPEGPIYNRAFAVPGSPGHYYEADFGYASCLVRLETISAPLYRRSMWLSGNPDEAQRIGARTPAAFPAWNAAWGTFRDVLAPADGTGKWGMRFRRRDQAAVEETNITDIDGGSGALTVAGLPGGFDPGMQVVVRNVRGLTPRVAGIYTIQDRAVTGALTTLTLEGVGPLGGGDPLEGEYTGTGYIRKLVWQTLRYRVADLRRWGKKARGGPTTRSHGVRKTRTSGV